ncbi:MAG: NADH-quinone oxidoreductase subunit D [Candidatus Glassbacteria bacterium]|nr:NADH-quinone oxidoreductase subunit D [Candidatus Glassbacteria bacterium]
MSQTTRQQSSSRTEGSFLNIGPSHPAMHGVVRIITELEGEKVLGAEIEIGYLHRCFEKDCEQLGYNQAFPYTDRLNYVSPLLNNVGWAMAVEKLFGAEVPERCQYIRVIVSEMSRIVDHLTSIGAAAMEIGALTVFLYFMKGREYLYDIIEYLTGSRITISYVRVGGVKADLPKGFDRKLRGTLKEINKIIAEVDKLLTRNRIFIDRTSGIGTLSRERSISYGITGPLLRAAGEPYDVRKDMPYLVYDRFDFEVPIADTCDAYARYLVRMEEMRQSVRIIEQALDQIPPGAIAVDRYGNELSGAEMVELAKRGKVKDYINAKAGVDLTLDGTDAATAGNVNLADNRTLRLPSKEETYGNIEGLMAHFMQIMDNWGVKPPVGEAYQAVEGANGELGFYLVSNGEGRPMRARCRGACFFPMAALHEMLIGDMIADIVPSFGSINMIAGELDR